MCMKHQIKDLNILPYCSVGAFGNFIGMMCFSGAKLLSWKKAAAETPEIRVIPHHLWLHLWSTSYKLHWPALQWEAHLSSSEPSLQSSSPSHTWLYMTQSRLSLQSLKPWRHLSGVTLGIDPDAGASWVKKKKKVMIKRRVWLLHAQFYCVQTTNATAFLWGLPRSSRHSFSSEPSGQWERPSQTFSLRMHILPSAHKKSSKCREKSSQFQSPH